MSTYSIGELLRAFVIADTAVNALVADRMYPLRLQQKNVIPALTYIRVSGVRIGQLKGKASAAEPRYQIDSWAQTQKEALQLGAAVRYRLEGYSGEWVGTGSPPDVTVNVAVRFVSEMDQFDTDILGGLCRHSADYFISHGSNGGVL